ncbi:MAG: hypothetical protein ACHRXM_17670, partial [Isosphaerales bacterium]
MGGMVGATGGMMAAQRSPSAMKRVIRRRIAEAAAALAIRDPNPHSKAIIKKLDEPISMSFNEETPLEDVLKYVHQATVTKTYNGIPIYVDPKGCKEAEATMTSTIRGLDLEGVPLKTTLRLLLKQLGLAYGVRDGVLIISSEQDILDELGDALREFDSKDNMEGGPGGFGGAAPEPPGGGSE